jgi:hypothetical protein
LRTLVQGGAWRWALALGFAIALGGGAWAYDVFGPQIQSAWPRWKAEGEPWLRETLLWIEFLASVTLSIALLCWLTALFFCLFCAILLATLYLLNRFSRQFTPHRGFDLVRNAVDTVLEKERMLGTVLNLLASLAALLALSSILKRPLDHWDVGVQLAVSAVIELIVLQVLFA